MPVPQAQPRDQPADVLSLLQQQRLSELRHLHTRESSSPLELGGTSDASRQLLLFRNQLRSVPRTAPQGGAQSRDFWGDLCPFDTSEEDPSDTAPDQLAHPRSRDRDRELLLGRAGVPRDAVLPLERTGIQPCCFLAPGQRFSGKQQVARSAPISSGQSEDWDIELQIQEVDLDRGHIAGCISVDDRQPSSRGSVATFWEGEIVDNKHATFLLSRWGASPQVHLRHWSKFESFGSIQADVRTRRGRCASLHSHGYVFFRLKETFFTSSEDCGLTIAGFYFCALSRKTGALLGYYYDAASSPFQKLTLRPDNDIGCGQAFGRYELYQD